MCDGSLGLPTSVMSQYKTRPRALENRRAVILVQPERVDTPGVSLAGGIFAGKKANAEQRFEVVFDQGLQRFFQIRGITLQFSGLALGEVE